MSAKDQRSDALGRALCRELGHDFRDRARPGPYGGYREDGSYGWRMCACDRSIPEHANAPADPAGGDGCGMVWRLCGRGGCDHIEERHVTEHAGAGSLAVEGVRS
jgi:hypothetical protein